VPVTFYMHGLCLVTSDQRAMLIVSGRLPEQQLILVFIPEARFPGHARMEGPVTFYMHGLCLVTSDHRALLFVSGRQPEQQVILVFRVYFCAHSDEGPVFFPLVKVALDWGPLTCILEQCLCSGISQPGHSKARFPGHARKEVPVTY